MSSRRGAAAIEFALVLPAMLSILLGIFEYGYHFSEKQGLYNVITETCGEDFNSKADELILNYFDSCLACTYDTMDEEEHYICDFTKPHYQITGFFPANMVPQAFNLRAVKQKTEEQIDDTGG